MCYYIASSILMEHRSIHPKDDTRIVRSNKLLEARYKTSLQQMRIMLWLISEIKPEDRDFQTYRISVKDLAKFAGTTSKNVYRELADATKGMVSRVVEIGSLEDETYLQVGLISHAKYSTGDGFIDLAISPELKPYLVELQENFTTAYLRDLMQMKTRLNPCPACPQISALTSAFATLAALGLEVSERIKAFSTKAFAACILIFVPPLS